MGGIIESPSGHFIQEFWKYIDNHVILSYEETYKKDKIQPQTDGCYREISL